MLLDILSHLELDPLVGVLDTEDLVTLDLRVGLPDEIDGASAQLRYDVIDAVFGGVVAKDLDLEVQVALLMIFEMGCRVLGKSRFAHLLELF